MMTVAGWGITNLGQGLDSAAPQAMEVDVPIVLKAQCQTLWTDNADGSTNLGDFNICAGFAEGGKDACTGDSGGPLFKKGSDVSSPTVLYGIVSYGWDCANPNIAAVYTKVSYFSTWIESMKSAIKLVKANSKPVQHGIGDTENEKAKSLIVHHQLISPNGTIHPYGTNPEYCLENIQKRKKTVVQMVSPCNSTNSAQLWSYGIDDTVMHNSIDGFHVRSQSDEQCLTAVMNGKNENIELAKCVADDQNQIFKFVDGLISHHHGDGDFCAQITNNNKKRIRMKPCMVNRYGMPIIREEDVQEKVPE